MYWIFGKKLENNKFSNILWLYNNQNRNQQMDKSLLSDIQYDQQFEDVCELIFVETPVDIGSSSINHIINILGENDEKKVNSQYQAFILNTLTFQNQSSLLKYNNVGIDENGQKKESQNLENLQRNVNQQKVSKEQGLTNQVGTFQNLQKKNSIQRSKLQTQNQKSQQIQISCNCKKTECLKMYCQCFKNSRVCNKYCVCLNCENHQVKSKKRRQAISRAIDRDDAAFLEIKNYQGCRCTKSKCRQKYCECYLKGVFCGKNCLCSDCKNVPRKCRKNKEKSN